MYIFLAVAHSKTMAYHVQRSNVLNILTVHRNSLTEMYWHIVSSDIILIYLLLETLGHF